MSRVMLQAFGAKGETGRAPFGHSFLFFLLCLLYARDYITAAFVIEARQRVLRWLFWSSCFMLRCFLILSLFNLFCPVWSVA